MRYLCKYQAIISFGVNRNFGYFEIVVHRRVYLHTKVSLHAIVRLQIVPQYSNAGNLMTVGCLKKVLKGTLLPKVKGLIGSNFYQNYKVRPVSLSVCILMRL